MRVRTDRKRDEILQIARAAFLQHGYAATSMAAIAAAVGGSKSTLYGYFPTKEALFGAVVHSVGEKHVVPVLSILDGKGSPREILGELARAVIRFLLLPEAVASYRMVIAEAGRFPELGRTFFAHGPQRGLGRIAAWIQAQIEAGRLHPADPAWLAQQFGAMCEAGPCKATLCGVTRRVSAREQAALANFVVETFLRAHATPEGDAVFGRERPAAPDAGGGAGQGKATARGAARAI
ncbi:Transcription regulator of multidrug efflux pump operon, TetR (AcrR) family [Rhodovastum atsumiense]|uniref:TetR/AcrR family transcriptional regulator n=1 Tax=Rhodovastum atsumiense TaxID=504468 RepID=A0A5M6IZK7_9PROT|nr:TetR/AcrR family transcriptional regulator [Rhodovastum atsumiense]KAA5613399.1 TetR/AcrR family transcriptional regulator [Rhodovastum atsumiense]CAH2603106.1 Transcription regulator of multidrug efflux pump operon, TetR (AcrR) family [Rhodovastum atsumiense]